MFGWIAGTFMLFALAAGIVIVLLPPVTETGQAVSAPVAVPESPAEKPASAQLCKPQKPVDQDPQTVFDTRWQRLGSMQVPSSSEAGPAVNGVVPQCFSRSPEGALYSAVTLTAGQMVAQTAADRIAVIENRLSRQGTYQLQYERAVQAGDPGPIPTSYQFAGYRVLEYSPDRAVVQVAMRAVNGALVNSIVALDYTMVWEHNDWLMLPPPESGQPRTVLDSFENFTPWGAAG